MLSFFSMGTRVGLIFLLSAADPLNFFRVQNFAAADPSGKPCTVTANCVHQHSTDRVVAQPAAPSLPLLTLFVMPILSGDKRW